MERAPGMSPGLYYPIPALRLVRPVASHLEFYDVVKVLPSDFTQSLGISGAEGVVVGIAEPESEGDPIWYSVLVGEETFSVVLVDLEPTGVQLDRSDVHDGSAIRAVSEGNIIGGRQRELLSGLVNPREESRAERTHRVRVGARVCASLGVQTPRLPSVPPGVLRPPA